MAKDESPNLLEKAWSFLTGADDYSESSGECSGNRGPLGSPTNCEGIDKGTLCPKRSKSRAIVLDPVTVYVPPDEFTENDDFYRKLELGMDIYEELGLAGQIAEKFLALPYRKGGNITFTTGKLKGKGLVCTSFARIFGALWFAGDVLDQEKLGSKAVKVRPRRPDEDGKPWKIVAGKKVVGETDTKWEAEASRKDRNEASNFVNPKTGKRGISLSPALVYSDKFGGTRVNEERLPLKELVPWLDRTRLYAMITYSSPRGAKPLHVWFLIYSNTLKHWVRIESTGKLSGGGRGSGPGIYKFVCPKKRGKKYYQAWDWGHWYKPRDPAIDQWDYTE